MTRPPPTRPWPRRLGRWLLAGAGVYLLYALVAGMVAPPILRAQAEQRLTRLTGGALRIQHLSLNPFMLRATVRGLTLAEPGGGLLLSWSNLVADAQLSSLWRREVRLRSLEAGEVEVNLGRNPEGRFRLYELLRRIQSNSPPAAADAPARGLPAFTLERFSLTNGTFIFRDDALAEPFALRLAPVNLSLTNLTTRGAGAAWLEFVADGDNGERIEWTGRLSLDPPQAEGLLAGRGFALARPRPYSDAVSPLRPVAGVMEFTLPYRLGFAGTNLVIEATGARLTVTNLAVVERDSGRPFAEAGGLQLAGVSASLTGRAVSAEALRLHDAQLHARRLPGGESNLRGLVEPEVIEELIRGFTDWRFALAELDLTNAAVELEDTTLDPPVKLAADAAQVRATGLSNRPEGPPMALEASLRALGGGRVSVQADATLFPARARAQIELADLPLAPLSPYLQQFLRLTLNRGAAMARLEATYGRQTPDAPLLLVAGDLAVKDLAATETTGDADFIRWEEVALTGLRATLQPNRLELDELLARQLQTSLVLQTNGQLNVLGLLRQAEELSERAGADKEPAAAAPETTAPFWEQWPLRLDRLRIEEAALFAADDFIGGGFRSAIESLDGEVRTLALPATATAELDLRGRLSALSGFTVQGTLTPRPDAFAADLRVTTHRADLTQFTPYALRFAGYPVTRGVLDADVRYQVAGGELKAENKLTLDQFTLGAKTNSPDAINLPFKLGVALLKDRDGRIQLDVPLTGTLTDPQFRLAPLIGQALKNIVLKAASAPFRLLGALVDGGKDGGEEELEFVEFAAGSAELTPAATNRCAKLALALQQRPELQLVVAGAFDAVADRTALARAALDARLHALKAEESPGAPADAPLSPEERARLLRVLYARAFGAAPPAAGQADPGAPAGLTPGQIEQRLLETTEVTSDDLDGLANGRAEAARQALLAGGVLDAARVRTAVVAADDPAAGTARAVFRLE